jgi:hypothetical protein
MIRIPMPARAWKKQCLPLTYDPKVLTVSPSDITLGSIPSLGTGWHLVSLVDQATGQIGIDLYSTMAISATQAGSLVNINFHVVPGGSVPATAVQLVNSVTPNGRYFSTEVADDQGQYVLSPGLDRLVIPTGLSPISLAAPGSASNPLPDSDIHGRVLLDILTKRLEEAGENSSPLLDNEGDGVLATAISASKGFQVGILPVLNTLLLQNSPSQLATDKLFLDLAQGVDLAGDAVQDDFWITSIRHEYGNSELFLAAEAGADYAAVSQGQQATDQPVSDRMALETVFAQMDW